MNRPMSRQVHRARLLPSLFLSHPSRCLSTLSLPASRPGLAARSAGASRRHGPTCLGVGGSRLPLGRPAAFLWQAAPALVSSTPSRSTSRRTRLAARPAPGACAVERIGWGVPCPAAPARTLPAASIAPAKELSGVGATHDHQRVRRPHPAAGERADHEVRPPPHPPAPPRRDRPRVSSGRAGADPAPPRRQRAMRAQARARYPTPARSTPTVPPSPRCCRA